MDTEHGVITEPARRIEVFTGAGRRRTWSAQDKARIVAESMAGQLSVSAVARRHGLTPQQLFNWRRQSRGLMCTEPLFVPAVVAAAIGPPRRSETKAAAVIEVEMSGVMVRIGRGAESRTIAAVLAALKAGA